MHICLYTFGDMWVYVAASKSIVAYACDADYSFLLYNYAFCKFHLLHLEDPINRQ